MQSLKSESLGEMRLISTVKCNYNLKLRDSFCLSPRSKDILLQYQELTDFSDETCREIYRETKEAIEAINPEKEYYNEEFTNAFR